MRDDTVEPALRRLSAVVYEPRTRDKVGANHMLGATPPGSLRDIAPGWLVDSATSDSKADYQRTHRVFQRSRSPGARTDVKGKGKGRGKGKDEDGVKQA